MALGIADHVYVIRSGRIVVEDGAEALTDRDELFRWYLS